MTIVRTAIIALTFAIAAGAAAQQPLLGKYSARWETQTAGKSRASSQTADLELTSAEGGVVKGTLVRHTGLCRGTYPVEGKLVDTALDLRVVKSDAGGVGCVPNLKLTQQGSKLVGTIGGGPEIEFAK